MFPHFVAPSANQQRGAVVIMTVGFMLLAVLFLALAVDTGRLYLDKRKLQRVADVAALEAVTQNGVCRTVESDDESDATELAIASALRNGHSIGNGRTLQADCGSVVSVAGIRQLAIDQDALEAIRVIVTHEVPASVVAGGIFGNNIVLTAEAIATRGSTRLAQLTIRNKVANIDSTRGPLLNALFGGLLGGSLNLDVASWQGLVGTQISLLSFSDQLATNIGLSAGGYDELLSTNVSVGQLVDAAVDVLERDGSTASTSITALQAIRLAAAASPANLQLGDILGVSTASAAAGLDGQISVFDLVEGFVQLAGQSSAATVSVPISLPGLLNTNLKVKITEPPMLSAVGDPARARVDPDGEDRIFVRTAQAKVLLSVDVGAALFPALQPLLNLVSLVNDQPLLNSTASLLGGNFIGALQQLLDIQLLGTTQRKITDIKIVDPFRLDLYIDGGGAQAKVTDFSCEADDRALITETKTHTGVALVGSLGSSHAEAHAAAFSTVAAMPAVKPVAILDIGSYDVRQFCFLSLLVRLCNPPEYRRANNTWTTNKALAVRNSFDGGGIGVEFVNAPINQNTMNDFEFTNPPQVGQAPMFRSVDSSQNLVASLNSTINGVSVKVFQPGPASNNFLGSVLATTGTVVNTVSNTVRGVITSVLSPLLDPLINEVLRQLGLSLAGADVGANMSCGQESGARLIR